MRTTNAWVLFVTALAVNCVAHELLAAEPDPAVLLKPIPEKLVVLTFDDGCRSHATIVAPILKRLGFGGTFYVSDFASFHTRKDWYLTWRQMQALAADGFEVGNHSRGHAAFSSHDVKGCTHYLLGMEDEFLANKVPKPTTFCWPFYRVNTGFFTTLAAHGYGFARGGHGRPYRPTVDSPFDVPSFSISDRDRVEMFVSYVQQAAGGRIVVITFHGVPDREHPSVGLEPATFKEMMRYLEENSYRAIAMRDLAKYIDVVKAAKLPPTARRVTEPEPRPTVKGDAPYPSKEIRAFRFPGLPPVRIFGTRISVTVPYATDVAALAPSISVPAGATVAPASGTVRDFTTPQTYTVTGQDRSTKVYTATVHKTAASTAKDMLTFRFPGPISGVISGPRIGVNVPPATDVTALAPTFTLSPFATAVPPSGVARDFSTPQTYTITAQDGSARVCTVTVVRTRAPNIFAWDRAAAGRWSDGSRWTTSPATDSPPMAAGRQDYVLAFNRPGSYTTTNDLHAGFLVNQLSFGGSSVTLAGKRLALATNVATGTLPRIHENASGAVTISAPIELASNMTVGGTSKGKVILKGLISGAGSLTKSGPGTLQISNVANTYSGGTIINDGTLYVFLADAGLGSGPVTLGRDATLRLERINGTNPLTMNGGTIYAGNGFGCSWNGAVTLNGNTKISSYANMTFNNSAGRMSGPGGFTQTGGTVTLAGANTYTGVTTVRAGTLKVKGSLYGNDPARWTPANINVGIAATLRISVGGEGEFTSRQAGTLLTNLTTGVNGNGLMAGSIFALDTANARDTVTVSAVIADSTGPGGGAFTIRKCGAGMLRLAGANTYTGPTLLDGGALSVASLNSVVGGKASSSLGAPTTIDNGEIVLGNSRRNGDCSLIYTGAGETSDRVVNLAGRVATVTFDQSGSGRLKLTSDILISGYGHNKTIVLKGSTAGTGEIAGSIRNPYDRAGVAATALTKTGTGTWTLSGANSYAGATTVDQGTLALASGRSLGANTDVTVAAGATLELRFKEQANVRKLILNGKRQPPGEYNATNAPAFIKGTGTLVVRP